jgi:hypothetical protein
MTRAFTATEDFVSVGLGVLLRATALALLGRSVVDFGQGVVGGKISRPHRAQSRPCGVAHPLATTERGGGRRAYAMDRKTLLMAGLFAVALAGGAAGCALDVTAMCERAGGTYAGGTCTRWSPGQQAAQDACEGNGGVYLRGQDSCELGAGGP